MADLVDLYPPSSVVVGSLILTCDMCDADITIDFQDLDQDDVTIEPYAMFNACPECGEYYDAGCVWFQSGIGGD